MNKIKIGCVFMRDSRIYAFIYSQLIESQADKNKYKNLDGL